MGARFYVFGSAAVLAATWAAGVLAVSMLAGGCTAAKNGERSTSTDGNEGFVTAVKGSADQEEIRLYYRILGSGADTLILVPGAHRGTIADRPDLVEPVIISFIQDGAIPDSGPETP